MKFNPLIPELTVANLKDSLHFYIAILGFKIEYERQESNFAFISLNSAQIMLEERNGNWETATLEHPFGRGINLQIRVDRLDPILKALADVKYPIFKSSRENWYRKDKEEIGQRELLIQDPDGFLLRLVENLGVRSAISARF